MFSLRLRPVASSAPLVLTLALSILPATPTLAQQGSPSAGTAQPLPIPLPDRTSASAAGDVTIDSPPAHLAVADGAVTMERETVAEPAHAGMALIPGDRLRTDRGRAEIYFPDGSVLDVDEFTTVELQAPGLLRMTSGRLLLTLARPAAGTQAAQYQIDTPAASAALDMPGEYRVGMLGSASTPQLEVAALRGQAELLTDRGSLAVRAGERTLAWADGAASYPERFNSARFDAFDAWAAAQRDQRTGGRSAHYLPADLRTYSGAFDRYGSWQQDPAYGYVWYPTVAAGWQPYSSGYWSALPRYGWTWIGLNTWSWPTHHYGRWGVASSRWFWIPDRRWGPGWVAWGSAPGYVSWTPLGFGNRPAFSISAAFGNAWAGWTVVPRHRFGVRGAADQYARPAQAFGNRSFAIRQSVAPPLPARVIASPGVVSRAAARSARTAAGGARPPVIDMTRRGAVSPRAPLANGVGARVVPRYPGNAANGAFADRSGSASPNRGITMRGGAQRGPASGFQGDAAGAIRRAPRAFNSAPRTFDSSPRGFGSERSRPFAPGGMRPGAPLPPPAAPGGGVRPRSGPGGMRGESRGVGPGGGGATAPRRGGPSMASGGAIQRAPSGPAPAGGGHSPGSRRPR